MTAPTFLRVDLLAGGPVHVYRCLLCPAEVVEPVDVEHRLPDGSLCRHTAWLCVACEEQDVDKAEAWAADDCPLTGRQPLVVDPMDAPAGCWCGSPTCDCRHDLEVERRERERDTFVGNFRGVG